MSAQLAIPLALPAPPAVLAAASNLLGRPRGLAWCAGLSLALHALLAAVALPGADEQAAPRQAVHRSAGAVRPLELRLIAAPAPDWAAAAKAATGGAAAVAAASPAAAALPVAPARPSPALAREPVPLPAPAFTPERSRDADPADDAAPAPAVAQPSQASDYDEYVPRPLLSRAPTAQAPVLIGSPPVELGIARHVGILALFIDETGEVRHVKADGPALPPALEQAAREAFMAARFSPGQLDGASVKSRIRVEVVFDNSPLK